MATAYIIIPPVNSIRFVEFGKARPTRFDQVAFDEFWHSESLLSFQEDNGYRAKAQSTDVDWVQFHHTGTHGFDVFLMNNKGEVVTTVPIFRASNNFAGNVWDAHGTITPVALKTAVFRLQWGGVDLIDGEIYFLKFEVYFSADKSIKVSYLSEPIEYRIKHEGTMLINYTHKYNQHGIFWTFVNTSTPAASWAINMRLRIDGYIEDFTPDSNDTFYEDQIFDLRLLDSTPYRKFKLFSYDVSDYHIDKINRAFSCDTVFLNNKQYGKDDGAKIEVNRVDQESVKRCELAIREYWTTDSSLFQSYYDGGVIIDPGGGGSGAGFLSLQTSSGGLMPLTSAKVFSDEPTWTDYATELTSVIEAVVDAVPTYPLGLRGEFSYSSGVGLRYTADEADLFVPTFALTLLENSAAFSFTVVGAPVVFQYQFIGGSHVTFWGGTSLQEINYTTPANQYQTVTREYAAGEHSIKIYHDNSGMDSFKIPDQDAVITLVAGGLPEGVSEIELDGANLPTVSMLSFVNTKQNLHSLTIKNSNVDTIETMAFDIATWVGGFRKVDFSGNELSAAEIDSFFNAFVAGVVFIGGGVMNFSGQTPAAPPTEDSLAARDLLIGFGWELIFDL